MSDWLEGELSRHMRPVTAPGELRVRLGLAPAKRREFPRMVLAVAAAVVMMMAGSVAASRTAVLDLRQVAADSARSGEPLEFVSSDPGAISVWLGHAAGVVVPLRASDGVRFLGARVIRQHGVKVAAVEFRKGSDRATVLVARAGSAEGPAACKSKRNAILSPDAGCVLCHTL
jgi:hypothetical protein